MELHEGASTLDTSSLTGETLPRNVSKGDEVLAGVVNLTELLILKYLRFMKIQLFQEF